MSEEKKNFKKEFTPIPKGEYLVRMVSAEEKQTKNKKGVMLDCCYEVVKGDFKGRKIFGKFLVEHTSEKAQEIGNKMLNYYLEAVGVEGGLEGIGHDRTQIADNLEIPFVASIDVKDSEEYVDWEGNTRVSKPRNEIKGFKAR